MYEYFDKIENLPGSIEKERVLKEVIQLTPVAEEFLRFAFNDTVYGIDEKTFKNAFNFQTIESKNKEAYHVSDYIAGFDFPKLQVEIRTSMEDLEIFASKLLRTSGNAKIEAIRQYFSILPPNIRKWWCRALLHNLRCGVQVKTVNNVFKELGLPQIEKFALQLCDTINVYDEDEVYKKLTFPCTMECKYDGIRVQAQIYSDMSGNTEVTLMSRRGKEKTMDYPEIVEALKEQFEGENIILDGEVIADSFQKLTRKDDKSVRKYILFDLLTDEKLPYISRWDNLTSVYSNTKAFLELKYKGKEESMPSIVQLAEHFTASTLRELQDYYNELNNRKEEGIIIKLHSRIYERGSRKHMFKCKKVMTADLEIYGYSLGEGRRSKQVASLQLRDKSGKVKVDVGSGITDGIAEELTEEAEKEWSNSDYTANFMFGIVEIAFNEITETGSIRFPRLIRFRDDKSEADDLSNKLNQRRG